MKQCIDCLKTLPYTAFSKKASCKDGYNVRCKQCHTNKYKRGTLERVIKKIYLTQIDNSIKRNHPLPSYTLNELIDWVKQQDNWDDLYNTWIESNYDRMLAPSIDRLDSLLPYSLSNIRLVSWKVNQQQSADDKYYGTDTRTLRPVRAINKDGSIHKEYYSIKEAMRDINTSSYHGITSVADGKPIKDGKGNEYMPRTYKGYKWEWI